MLGAIKGELIKAFKINKAFFLKDEILFPISANKDKMPIKYPKVVLGKTAKPKKLKKK